VSGGGAERSAATPDHAAAADQKERDERAYHDQSCRPRTSGTFTSGIPTSGALASRGPTGVQWSLTQTIWLPQTLLHAPQLFGSFVVLTHPAAHIVVVAGQPQPPFAQVWPPVHVTPHPPQLLGSFETSTHAPLQSMSGGLHVVAHEPLLHTWGEVHAVAQPPQWAGSVIVLTHTPPQSVSPALQAHMLKLHVVPPVHAIPHPPQLLGSAVVSTQLPPQSVWPAGHVVTQVPPEHA